MNFDEIVRKRYAVKKFSSEKLTQEQVDNLLELVRLSASSMNFQPWKIIIIESQELKQKLKTVSWNQDQIDSCSHLLVFCTRTDFEKNLEELKSEMLNAKVNSSKVSAFTSMIENFLKTMDNDQKTCWAKNQVYIALGNALNGAKSLGFDSCPIEGFDPKAYSEILKIPKGFIPTVVCPIGYADKNDVARPKIRFSIKDIVIKR